MFMKFLMLLTTLDTNRIQNSILQHINYIKDAQADMGEKIYQCPKRHRKYLPSLKYSAILTDNDSNSFTEQVKINILEISNLYTLKKRSGKKQKNLLSLLPNAKGDLALICCQITNREHIIFKATMRRSIL